MSGSHRWDGYSPAWKQCGNDLDDATRHVSFVGSSECARMTVTPRMEEEDVRVLAPRSHGWRHDL